MSSIRFSSCERSSLLNKLTCLMIVRAQLCIVSVSKVEMLELYLKRIRQYERNQSMAIEGQGHVSTACVAAPEQRQTENQQSLI